jgi:hypothetical protein
MAIKKLRPESEPEPAQPGKLPNFDETRTESSIEDLMDQAIQSSKDSGFEKLPTGNWVGIVNLIDTWESEKGVFYRIHLVCNVDDNPTFRHTIWCHILLEDRRTFHDWGPVFYARHIAALGYPKTANQKQVRDEINRKKPGVIVTSQPNKKNPEWNDVSIRDRIGDDNEEVQLVRENLDNQPY